MVTRPDHLGDEADERAPGTAETEQAESLGVTGFTRRTWMKAVLTGVAALGLDACDDAGREKAKAGDLKLYNGIVHPMAGTTGIDFSTRFREPVTLRITVFAPNGDRLHQEEHSVGAGSDSVSMAFIPNVPVGSRIVISRSGSISLEFEVLDSGIPTFAEGS